MEVKTLFEQQKKQNAANPNILFLMITATATDKAQLKAAGAALQGLGVKCVGIGAGTKAAGLKAELGMVATSDQFIRAGALSTIVQAESFNGLIAGITKGEFLILSA